MKPVVHGTSQQLREIIENASTIAVIGCSALPHRTSFRNTRYLQESGFRILPVNPNYSTILGEKCYPDIRDIPATTRIDIVNIFRHPSETASAIRSVLARIKITHERPVIWTQLGVSTDEARTLAEASGLIYIANRCLMVEHSRLL